MRLRRPTAFIAALLIITFSTPPSLLSQPSPMPSRPKQPASQRRQLRRPQRADALAPAIKELLETRPLAPRSLDEKASEGNASEDDDKPPADDAPIKELIAYWSGHADDADAGAAKPSDEVRRRLLEAFEDRPGRLFYLADLFPERAETHDRLYKLLCEEADDKHEWKSNLRTWLRRNSAYFRDELIEVASAAGDGESSADEDLRALARLDWGAARPILEEFASAGKPQVAPISLGLLYEHAMRDGDSAQSESYRARLKAIVADWRAPHYARTEALSSLTGGEWNGQEEWFISLFLDQTLDGLQRSILENALDTNADRWFPVVSALVGHNQRAAHNAAVECLVVLLSGQSGDEAKRKEAARILSPWLTDPNWAHGESDRTRLLHSVADLEMPELIPGLIWVLEHDGAQDNCAAAAEALSRYHDSRAVPALRRALENDEHEPNREMIVTALAECGGFSDDEIAEAVEAYAEMVVTEKGEQEIEKAKQGDLDKPLSLKVSIGRIVHESETIQATEGLAVRLIEKAGALRLTHPAVSRQILRTIEGAPLRVAEINLVERIGEGWADVDSITLALETRDTLMKSAGNELYRLINQGGYAAGVAAAILNDEREWKTVLENGDAKAQLASLACARFLRDKLPVEIVGKLLNSPNRALAKAAESYLEVEDGPEARKLVLARHPGETYILGDLTAISNSEEYVDLARHEEDALRKEMQRPTGPEAIYAVLQAYSGGFIDGVIIRVRSGEAEMSVHETEGRRNVRRLTDGEFEELKSFTSRQEIEDLGPESYVGEDERGDWNYEYLRLTKGGGRRIALDGLRRAPKNPTPHEELSGLFYRLSRSGEFTARYTVEDEIPGVDVVFADKNQSVLKVCAEGGEIRALIEERGAEYRQDGAKAAPEWREFSSGRPGAVRNEPPACRALNMPSSAPMNARIIRPSLFIHPAQSGGALFYSNYDGDPGVWKVEPGRDPVKIVSGYYSDQIITPDGKWFVATKLVTEDGNTVPQLTRRNLESGEQFVVSLPQKAFSQWLQYAAAHGKVLVGFYANGVSGYLLDPETGTTQPVKGELRPLTATLSHAPQSAGAPNLFWAAIYDLEKRMTRFGRYDSKNFVFTPLLEFPELELSGDDIWVDAAGGKIWFTYKGHLLRLPLPAQMK